MAEKRVTSTDIKIALSKLHSNRSTYFFTECKTCSTYFPDPQGLLKFDGLAITKSYTKPNIIGYEIKVSRNDFKQDNKWHLWIPNKHLSDDGTIKAGENIDIRMEYLVLFNIWQ